jgi:hypothetical protein
MIQSCKNLHRKSGAFVAVLALTIFNQVTHAGPYASAVLADNPVAFWQLNETSGNIAHDSAGSYNGVYTNVVLNQPGYTAGTDPSALSVAFGGYAGVFSDSYVSGMPLDFATNGNGTFSVETWVNGPVQVPNSGIVGKGPGSGEQFYLDCGGANSAYRFFIRNTNNIAFTASGTAGADGSWHHLVGVCDEAHGYIMLYVDGQLEATTAASGGIHTSANPFMNIGSRQSGSGSYNDQFAGWLSGVAVYNYSLSQAQIQNHYYAAGIAPTFVVQPPQNVYTNEGINLVLTDVVSGTPPLSYQWTMDGTPIASATNGTLVISNISAATYSGHALYLTVTNAFGSSASSGTSISLISGGPVIASSELPNQLSLYNGEQFTYSATANGTEPIYYQWFENGTAIPGATNSAYTATAMAGPVTYQLVVSNDYSGGSISASSSVTLTGVPVPTDSYGATMLAAGPVAYWRLNEPLNTSTANDYAGGHDGAYNNVQLGLPGFSPLDPNTVAGFGLGSTTSSYMSENDNSGIGVPLIDFSAPPDTNVEFSIEAWVNGPAAQNATGSAIVCKGNMGTDAFLLDASGPANYFRFYVRKAGSGGVSIINSSSHPDGNWHHLVAVCDEAGGVITLYVDGANAGQAGGMGNAGLYSTTTPVSIGAQNGGTYQFVGSIAEVSMYNYAMTPAQVLAHYNSAPIPPYFTQEPPTNIVGFIGQNVTLPAAALGAAPMTNQWYRNGVALTGQTNVSLTLTNLQPGTNTYVFEVFNPYGATNTPGTVVAVAAGSGPATLVTDVTPLATARYAGLPLTYSVIASGSALLRYQWYFNSNSIAGATNSGYTIASLAMSSSGYYYCTISNALGGVVSSIANLTVVPGPTNVYPKTILLDHPVAYYRLDETNGSPLGYDYVGGNNGQYTALTKAQLPQPGTNGFDTNFDSDTACYFGIGGASAFNSYLGNIITNVDFAQPNGHNGAFSVEAWVNGPAGVTQDSGACIVAKGQGGAEQFAMDVHAGIRFYVRNSSGATLVNAQTANTLDGSFAAGTSNWQMDGRWHHLVGVCDQANSNLLLYVDGTLIGPNFITNGVVPTLVYGYDLNHPGSTGTNGVIAANVGINETTITTSMENSVQIGSRNMSGSHTGNGAYNLPFVGTIDEVALYSYALTPAQVYTHYAVGAGLPLPLAAQNTNSRPVITWLSASMLQSATSPTGPWTTITNAASPYAVSAGTAQQFYRLQIH